MAKVTGPLFSISASGKIADSMVYFPWKGLHVVRQWLKPTNPESADQGNRRVMLGGLGRAPKYVQKNSIYHTHALGVAIPPNTWISTFVKYVMTTYFTDVAGFDAIQTELGLHPARNDFRDRAGELGLTVFDLNYKSMANSFSARLQLYMLAKYGWDQYQLNNLKFATDPYTKDIATWNNANIVQMIAEFAPV